MKLPTCAALSLWMLASAAGCGFTSQRGYGDENGTPVWLGAVADREDALRTAQEHCARYGKAATETSGERNRVDFDCVEPASLRRIVPTKAIGSAALAELRRSPQIQVMHYRVPPLWLDPPRQPREVVDLRMRDIMPDDELQDLPGELRRSLVGLAIGLSIDMASVSSQQAEASGFGQHLVASEQRGARLIREHSLADPILGVKAQLLLALRDAGLRDIRDVPVPIPGQTADGRPTENLREGMVIELGTRNWTLRTSARALDFLAYGQLRRAGEDAPLWAAECHFPQQILPAVAERQREVSGLGTALKASLVDVAKTCAAGLAASLLQGGNSQ